MSRGLGDIQTLILRSAMADETEPMTVEKLRWTLYRAKNPAASDRSDLPTKWNNSFSRAISSLVKRKRLTIERRPLESLEECVQHYPGKTLSGNSYSVRSFLLPVLLEWTNEKEGLIPKYGIADNEVHHYKNLQKTGGALMEKLSSRWPAIEERLRSIYGNAPKRSDNLLRLICKGNSLFRPMGVSSPYALTELIELTCASGLLPGDLKAKLWTFLEAFLPLAEANALQFRSFVHELVDRPRHGQYKLQPAALAYLHKQRKEYIEKMPGFAVRENEFAGKWNPNKTRFEYDESVLNLLDHNVFCDFSFIAIKERSASVSVK
jgi:hypothetical protein